MNNIINKGLMSVLMAGLLVLFSCDETLDINQSPNNPAGSTPALTLPVAQAALATSINLDLGIMAGFLSQYWTQAPQASQYQAFDRYNYTGNATQTGWLHLYAWAMQDMKFVRDQGLEDGTPNYAAIADILTAYTMQVVTDFWGRAPLTNALEGKAGNLTPDYDDPQDIYDDLIVILDRALENLDLSGTAINPGADDLIYGGDMRIWQRFANTLKLRIYLRQAEAREDVARAGIEALYASGAEFLRAGETALVPYSGASNNENPLHSGDVMPILSGVNIIASETIMTRLRTDIDPRIDFFYDVASTGAQSGSHNFLNQGDGALPNGPSNAVTDYSVPSRTNLVAANSPVYFMTDFESLFLQAEAVARGWGDGDVQALYDAGVQASFTITNSGDANTFLTGGGVYEYPSGTLEQNLSAIAYQKWLAMCGFQNVEAWAEHRRTQIPAFDQSSAGVGASLAGSQFPQRALYPTSEVSNNPNTPPNGNIGDPVWWSFEALN